MDAPQVEWSGFLGNLLYERPVEVGGAEELDENIDPRVAFRHQQPHGAATAEADRADTVSVRLRRRG